MIMRDSRRSGSFTCLLDLARSNGDQGNDCEFEESDPSGRYGRYREVLGRGAFKTVYKAFDEFDGIEVAWNQVKMRDVLQTPEDLERLYSEVHLLKTLKHRNIIKLYHSWVDTGLKNINFITEIFTSGTLRQYRKKHKHVDIKAVKNWSRQILRGLLHLHSHDPPIIHRDLKCDNIFINGNQGEVKIGDLGLATILHQARAAHSVIGTPEFMAPELYEEEYTELVDIYSFGMCLLEMVTFEYPYSECINAAQIYKKVTSGKKPAALNKVKDPDVRHFVEKCLATASRRLSARELLMDPFLRCDGDRDRMECSNAFGGVVSNTDDMVGFRDFLGKVYCRPPSFGRSLAEANSLSSISEAYQASTPAVVDFDSGKNSEHSIVKSSTKSSHPKEDKIVRNVNFRVKGKRRENGIVHLRLRMADTEGQVRIIHFPFDVESDTAMSVASEMVAELDITDQDVTKIAEMIDTAILLMVSEWRPGVAIDEAYDEGEDHLSKTPIHCDYFKMHRPLDHLSTMSSGSSLIDESNHGLTTWHGSAEALAVSSTLGPQTEGTMHGRFEEVMYHHRMSGHSALAEEQCTVSSDSSEVLGDCDPTDESSSPVSPIISPSFLMKNRDAVFHSSGIAPGSAVATLNKFVECKRNTGLTNWNGKKGDSQGGTCADRCHFSVNNLRNAELLQKDLYGLNNQGNFSAQEFPAGFDDDDNSELVTQQLKELALRYEQELRELQRKHEEALLELRNQWWHKRESPSFLKRPQCGYRIKQERKPHSLKEQILNKHMAMGRHHFSDGILRNHSDSDIQGNCQSGRVSLKMRVPLLSQVDAGDDPGILRDFETCVGDCPSGGQTALPLKVTACKPLVPTFVRDVTRKDPDDNSLYKIGMKKSSCHMVATFKGQNLVDPNAGVLFCPIRAETLEQIPI